MSEKNNFLELSKYNWTRNDGKNPEDSQLIIGCLQRVADALEAQNNLLKTQNEILSKINPNIDVKITNKRD